jgi:hypothetical protein
MGLAASGSDMNLAALAAGADMAGLGMGMQVRLVSRLIKRLYVHVELAVDAVDSNIAEWPAGQRMQWLVATACVGWQVRVLVHNSHRGMWHACVKTCNGISFEAAAPSHRTLL